MLVHPRHSRAHLPLDTTGGISSADSRSIGACMVSVEDVADNDEHRLANLRRACRRLPVLACPSQAHPPHPRIFACPPALALCMLRREPTPHPSRPRVGDGHSSPGATRLPNDTAHMPNPEPRPTMPNAASPNVRLPNARGRIWHGARGLCKSVQLITDGHAGRGVRCRQEVEAVEGGNFSRCS